MYRPHTNSVRSNTRLLEIVQTVPARKKLGFSIALFKEISSVGAW